MAGGVGYDTDLAGRKKFIREHIDELLNKGYSKKEIKKHLLEGGHSWILVNKHLYPSFSVWVIAGMILLAIIIIIGAVVSFTLISRDSSPNTLEGTPAPTSNEDDITYNIPDEAPRLEIPESVCRRFLEDPTRYEGREDYDQMQLACNELSLEVFDCSTIEDAAWQQRCLDEVAEDGYFISEETWKKVIGG